MSLGQKVALKARGRWKKTGCGLGFRVSGLGFRGLGFRVQLSLCLGPSGSKASRS